MAEDIRVDIKNKINQFRTAAGLPALHLHNVESFGCKKQAEWLVRYDIFNLSTAESDISYRPRGWTEINTAGFSDSNALTHAGIKALVDKAIESALQDSANARKVLNARKFIAADISYPKQVIAVCIRLF